MAALLLPPYQNRLLFSPYRPPTKVIDTVEFRIHDLQLHFHLGEFLDRGHLRQGKSVTMSVDEGTGEITHAQKLVNRRYLHLFDTGKTMQVAHFNELKSSHYTIAYRIDYLADFISFNVSVPKYAFGTNILHYNTPPGARDFQAWNHSELSTNLAEVYPRLIAFLRKFFLAEFGEIRIMESFVEICRLDLCYNQMFANKDDALGYLDQLKKLRKKGSRDGSNSSRDWRTSLMYKTKRWSFKIYHKGSEFEKNDAKKLNELNEKQNAAFDVPYYQAFADRILRYEMTFRKSYMSYLYMNKIFRKNCHIWKSGVKLWQTAKNKKANPEAYLAFRRGLENDDKKAIDYVNNFINKSKQFYMSGKHLDKDFDRQTDEYAFNHPDDKNSRFYVPAKFSRALVDVMAAEFLRVLGEYHLELQQNTSSILGRLQRRNADIQSDRTKLKVLEIDTESETYKGTGRKISEAKIRLILSMLEAGQTFEDIGNSGLFSARTWYNYRKDLEALGVTSNNLLALALPVSFDLREYNTELLHNVRKFVQLTF